MNEKRRKGVNEMRRFWEELKYCLKHFGTERMAFLFGDMNAQAGGVETVDVVW